MATTRRELRQGVASLVRDLTELTASADGSTNTLQDAVELIEFDNTFSSSQLVITSGHADNVGRICRVLKSKRDTASITFVPELPQPIRAGDTAELYNLRGNGFKVAEYNRILAQLVRDQARAVFRETSYTDFGQQLVNDVLHVTLPATLAAVYAVRGTADEIQLDVKPSRFETTRGWRVNPATRMLEIRGPEAFALANLPLTVYGYTEHPALNEDDDPCFIDPQWVIYTAASRLASKRGERSWDQWAVEWARMAAARQPQLSMDWQAGTVLLQEAV